ncbi:hypothetical protein BC332_03975 [Capsicum chinense]|nr:hypothetical protein BC332_03975 [Capsicum chinense]
MGSLDAGSSVGIIQPKDPAKGPMKAEDIGAQIPSCREAFIGAPSMEVTHSLAPVIAKHTTHNGKPAAISNASDYYGVMADECELTFVGKFTMGRPRIETISELDFNVVYFTIFMDIAGSLMRIFKWSLNFDPHEESSLAPIWVLLPELKFHLFEWNYLKQILAAVGTPLKEDLATTDKSRPNLAKVPLMEGSITIGVDGHSQWIEKNNRYVWHWKEGEMLEKIAMTVQSDVLYNDFVNLIISYCGLNCQPEELVISYMYNSFENQRVLPFKITDQVRLCAYLSNSSRPVLRVYMVEKTRENEN